jgi:hypothetical protein
MSHRSRSTSLNSDDERWMMVIGGLGNPIPFTAQPLRAVSPSGDRVAHMTSVATFRDGLTSVVRHRVSGIACVPAGCR